ncbi:porin [Ancylobacter oerskovii]|nr:porin [Ancylobacter oerskovii]
MSLAPMSLAAVSLLVAGGLLAGPALAGSPAPTAATPPATADRPDPVCASYGKGFTRLAGTSTCVKISGNVQVDGYRQSSTTGDPLAPALQSR